MTHSSLWADLGTIMMHGVANLHSGSIELDFIKTMPNPVVIKPGQIIATAVQIDSVEMVPDIDADDNKSIPLTESVFTCVERKDNFLYPCIVSDGEIDAEEEEFDLNMEIVEAPLAIPKSIPREIGIIINCVHHLLIRASKNLSPEESAKVKELLVEHETTFDDPEKPLTRTDTIEHEIPTSVRPVRIPCQRVAPGQRKIIEDEILKMEKEGTIQWSSGSWCSPIILVRTKDGTIVSVLIIVNVMM